MSVYKKTVQGFALLNAVLGLFLLVGIVYLIMHAVSRYHAEEKARDIGEELSPVVEELIVQSEAASVGTYTSLCGTSALLENIPAGYLQSLKTSGFDLCSKANVIIS